MRLFYGVNSWTSLIIETVIVPILGLQVVLTIFCPERSRAESNSVVAFGAIWRATLLHPLTFVDTRPCDFWCTCLDLNQGPLVCKTSALSRWATCAFRCKQIKCTKYKLLYVLFLFILCHWAACPKVGRQAELIAPGRRCKLFILTASCKIRIVYLPPRVFNA